MVGERQGRSSQRSPRKERGKPGNPNTAQLQVLNTRQRRGWSIMGVKDGALLSLPRGILRGHLRGGDDADSRVRSCSVEGGKERKGKGQRSHQVLATGTNPAARGREGVV